MAHSERHQSETVAEMYRHIEHIIQQIRTFHIFDTTAKLSMKDIYGDIFTTCAYLTNFQLPIIRPGKAKPRILLKNVFIQ